IDLQAHQRRIRRRRAGVCYRLSVRAAWGVGLGIPHGITYARSYDLRANWRLLDRNPTSALAKALNAWLVALVHCNAAVPPPAKSVNSTYGGWPVVSTICP